MSRRGDSCSDERPLTAPPRTGSRPRPRSAAGLALTSILLLAVASLLFPGAATAESPAEVAAEVAVDGVYVAPGRTDIDELAVATAIDEARALGGLRLVAVAPNDPQPDAAAFARRVQEASEADAAIVFPPGGGFEAHVIDEFSDAELRAVDAARSKATPVAAVEAFTAELLVEPQREFPPIVMRLVFFVLFLAAVLVAVFLGEQYLRRGAGPAGRGSARSSATAGSASRS